MKYYFYQPYISDEQIVITEDEYNVLSKFMFYTFKALSIIENYKIILERYSEYEISIYKETLNSLTYSQYTWSSNIDKIHKINGAVLNLLTSIKLFQDFTDKKVKCIFTDDFINRIRELKHNLYDNNKEYFICEILRNYAQHEALPIEGLQIKGLRNNVYCNIYELGVEQVFSYPVLLREKLARDKRINKNKNKKERLLSEFDELINFLNCNNKLN